MFVINVVKINFGVFVIFFDICFIMVEINLNLINKLFNDNVRIINDIVGIMFLIFLWLSSELICWFLVFEINFDLMIFVNFVKEVCGFWIKIIFIVIVIFNKIVKIAGIFFYVYKSIKNRGISD